MVARLLLGHLCQDLGVLRGPHGAGATEPGGSVPFPLHIGLRLKTKLSDFRTFHSGKNNCTWGKTRRHFSKSSSRFNNVPKASGVDRLSLPHQLCPPCQPHLLRHPRPSCAKDSRKRQRGRHRKATFVWPYYVLTQKPYPEFTSQRWQNGGAGAGARARQEKGSVGQVPDYAPALSTYHPTGSSQPPRKGAVPNKLLLLCKTASFTDGL